MSRVQDAYALGARLEVWDGVGWVDVLGSAASVRVAREGLSVGTMDVTLISESLDPAVSPLIGAGRPVRLRTPSAETVFTGEIAADSIGTVYSPLAPAGKQAEVTFSAVDAVSALAASPSPEGVERISELGHAVGGAGVPYRLNGMAPAGPEVAPAIVSYNSASSALDQVVITRDTAMGYAWVDRAGVLQVWDRDRMPTTVVGTLHEGIYGPDFASGFDPTTAVNVVEVVVLEVVAISGAVEEVRYGPYRDEPSIAAHGPRSGTYTVQGPGWTETRVAAYAVDVLARNAEPRRRVRSCRVPIRDAGQLPWMLLDLQDRVQVQNQRSGLSEISRVTSIEHDLQPGRPWQVTLTFAGDSVVAPPVVVTSPPPVQSQVRREAVQDAAASALVEYGGARDRVEDWSTPDGLVAGAKVSTTGLVLPEVVELREQTLPRVEAALAGLDEIMQGLGVDLSGLDTALAEVRALAQSAETPQGAQQKADQATAEARGYTDSQFPIGSTKIADDAITTPKLAALCVTAVKVAAQAIIAEKIAAGAVITDKLAALAVTAEKIATNQIIARHILAGEIEAQHLKVGAITADKLAVDALDGKLITGATFQTAKHGPRVLIQPDVNDVPYIAWLLDQAYGETLPAFFSASASENTPELQLSAGHGYMLMTPPQRSGHEWVTDRNKSTGLLMVSAPKDGSAAAQAQHAARIEMAAEYISIDGGPRGVNMNGDVTAFMKGGGVGTGAFRDSVRNAARTDPLNTFGNGETTAFVGTAPAVGTPKIRRDGDAVVSVSNSNFNLPIPPFPNGITSVTLTVIDGSNAVAVRAFLANSTLSRIVCQAFGPTGGAINNNIRVGYQIVGW